VTAFLKASDVCERYGFSTRTLHELTRNREIPFRILPGRRPCLFEVSELEAWQAGDYDELEAKDLPNGGVIVRLVSRRPLRRAA
jgi:predicted DNA-binding transcriptional regulator AlpA